MKTKKPKAPSSKKPTEKSVISSNSNPSQATNNNYANHTIDRLESKVDLISKRFDDIQANTRHNSGSILCKLTARLVIIAIVTTLILGFEIRHYALEILRVLNG